MIDKTSLTLDTRQWYPEACDFVRRETEEIDQTVCLVRNWDDELSPHGRIHDLLLKRAYIHRCRVEYRWDRFCCC